MIILRILLKSFFLTFLVVLFSSCSWLFTDHKYDYLLVINYNTKKTIANKGSAIFIHLTKNYYPTAGCIALKKKDFLILLKLINKKTKIKIF